MRGHSISNSNSKIPSFMFSIDVNFQDNSTINKLLGYPISNCNPKISSFTLDVYEFPRLYYHTHIVGTFNPYNNSEIPSFTFWIDMNFQDCSTINKLLRHSISNSNSKIPSFMFGMFMNFQGCTTITHCGDVQFPIIIPKFHLLRFGLI